uniref:Secreted protein n=1 Tax=Panagrellus redivivus TaxID=6233 RepID=A0A7E4WDY4_PANRE
MGPILHLPRGDEANTSRVAQAFHCACNCVFCPFAQGVSVCAFEPFAQVAWLFLHRSHRRHVTVCFLCSHRIIAYMYLNHSHTLRVPFSFVRTGCLNHSSITQVDA